MNKMIKLFLVLLLVSMPRLLFANSAHVVSNVTASQRTDDSKLVDIYYNLVDADGDVDFTDLMVLVSQWLQLPGNSSVDIAPQPDGDNIVDFRDFALFAENRLVGVKKQLLSGEKLNII